MARAILIGFAFTALLGFLVNPGASLAGESAIEKQNIETAGAFFEARFNGADLVAVTSSAAPGFVDHDPLMPGDLDGLVKALGTSAKEHPKRAKIARKFADGDIVILQGVVYEKADGSGTVVADIYRFDKDKIAEHWVTREPLMEKSTSDQWQQDKSPNKLSQY